MTTDAQAKKFGQYLIKCLVGAPASLLPIFGPIISETVNYWLTLNEPDAKEQAEKLASLQSDLADLQARFREQTQPVSHEQAEALSGGIARAIQKNLPRLDWQPLMEALARGFERLSREMKSQTADINAVVSAAIRESHGTLERKLDREFGDVRERLDQLPDKTAEAIESHRMPGEYVNYDDQKQRHAHGFFGREDLMGAINAALDRRGLVYLEGPAGNGKSAVMNALATEAEARGGAVAYHLAGGKSDNESLVMDSLIRQLSEQSAEACTAGRKSNATDAPGKRNQLHNMIRACPDCTIIIDGLDEFLPPQERVHLPELLLEPMPTETKLVAASRPHDPHGKRITESGQYEVFRLDDETWRANTHKAVKEFWLHYAIELGLSETRIREAVETAGNNFLVSTLQLDIWRNQKEAGLELGHAQSSPQGMIKAEIARISRNLEDAEGRGVREDLERLLLLLGLARKALPFNLLYTLAGLEGRKHRATREQFVRCFMPFFARSSAAKEYCVDAGDTEVLAPSHKSIRQWFVQDPEVCQPEDCWGHDDLVRAHRAFVKHLGDWRSDEPIVRQYALEFLPGHFIESGDWSGLVEILTNLEFVEAKCGQGMTYGLMADYRQALAGHPDAREENDREKAEQGLREQYGRDLIRYAKGEISVLTNIVSKGPRAAKELAAERERIETSPTDLDRLRTFAAFVQSESHEFARWMGQPDFRLQRAYNYADSGPVVAAAEELLHDDQRLRRVMRCHPKSFRPLFRPRSAKVRTFALHNGEMNSVCMTPDAHWALSGGNDGKLILWDLSGEQELQTVGEHSGPINAVCLTPDCRWALSGGHDRKVILWDLNGEREHHNLLKHSGPVRSVCLTPDCHWALSGGDDRKIILWCLSREREPRIMGKHTKWVRSVCLTPDGRWALSGGADHRVLLWDLSGKREPRILSGHSDWVQSVRLTPNGRWALSGGADHKVLLWDLSGEQELRTVGEHSGPINAVCLTPDCRWALSGGHDRKVILWDLNGEREPQIVGEHSTPIRSVCLTPDGRYALAEKNGGKAILWDLSGEPEPRKLGEHSGWVRSICLTPDGRWALSGGDDRQIILWDLSGEREHRVLGKDRERVKSVCLTSDGRWALSGGYDGRVVLWDLSAEQAPRTFWNHTGPVRSVYLTPDCRWALSGGEDRKVVLWDMKGNRTPRILGEHSGWVNSVCLTPDVCWALSGGDEGKVILWGLSEKRELRILGEHSGPVNSVHLALDGRWAISGGYFGKVILWDLRGEQKPLILGEHSGWVRLVYLTPDCRWALSAGNDRKIILWDLATKTLYWSGILPSDYTCVDIANGNIATGNPNGSVQFFTNPVLRQIWTKHSAPPEPQE